MTLAHLDEHGQPCTHHPAPELDRILALAMVGARTPSFHHDLASKLQGVMMSIDEVFELVDGTDPTIVQATEAAQTALKEVLALLNANRALTKPPVRTRISLQALCKAASERVSVKLDGEIPAAELEIAIPAMTQALSAMFDVAGGAGRARRITVDATIAEGDVVLAFAEAAVPPINAPEAIALAAFAIRAEHGQLSCAEGGARFVLRIPLPR